MPNKEHLWILRKGQDGWNEWREENPRESPDLAKADLSGANLRGANLSRAILNESTLFSHANLRGGPWKRFCKAPGVGEGGESDAYVGQVGSIAGLSDLWFGNRIREGRS